MINLKITMNNGKEFNIRNPIIDNIKDWITTALMPQGVQLLWFEIIYGHFIQVAQIQEIRKMTDEEVGNLNKPEIIGQEDNPIPTNQDAQEIVAIQPI